MRRIEEKRKEWLLAKSRKEMKQRSRKKRKLWRKHHKESKYSIHIDKKYNGVKLNAPAHLSLLEYKNETLLFFNRAINAIKLCKPRQKVYFDLKKVEYITPDAVMYLIAVVNNVKRARTMNIHCEGNLPINDKAREVIESTGFYSYVSSLKIPQNVNPNHHIQITCGKEANGILSGEICDFTGSSRLQTKRLYPMIVELMTNTQQHAYKDEESIMEGLWYIYAEKCKDGTEFVFLDTGVGIPTTIRRNFAERVIQLFLTNKSDAKYISSALKGKFRTETKLGYRGKGLPGIYEDSKVQSITELTVISGHGECRITDAAEIIETTSEIPFEGTLFYWKFNSHREEI